MTRTRLKARTARSLCHQAARTWVDLAGCFFRSAKSAWQTLSAAIREIFDENAYQRFLFRQHAAPSASSYREFLHEKESSSGITRCC